MANTNTEFNSIFQASNSRLSDLISNYADRMDWSDRLRQAFEDTGWSKAELSRRAEVSYDNVNKYLGGKVDKPRGDTLKKLATALDRDPIWLEHGTDPSTGTTDVPLMGFVGAGAQIEPDFEQTPPEGLDQITLAIPLPGDMVAFQVKGISMLPRYDEGDVIIVWREQKRSTDSFLGEEAAVRTRDGRRFLKTIRRGDRGYTLESWNDHPIEGQEIEWVGEIYVTIRANQLRRMVNQINRQGGLQGQLRLKTA